MNHSPERSYASDAASQVERPEQQAYGESTSSRTWAPPPPPRSHYRDERFNPTNGAPTLQTRGRPPTTISPWLFVMATALNTMVAAVLAVIITLGVVRQERTDSHH